MTFSEFVRAPGATDDKYSRGVVGFVTGSDAYPGAALLGITAAMRTGVGMVRYLGPQQVSDLVIQARPETVLQDGRAQSWVVGSGVPTDDAMQAPRIKALAESKTLLVVDAGALQIIDFANCTATCVLTPHAGEAAALLNKVLLGKMHTQASAQQVTRADVEAEPVKFALLIATLTKQLTVLKGNQTVIAQVSKDGTQRTHQFAPAPAVLATAGSGDVLAGIIGALLAANAEAIGSGQADIFAIVKSSIELQARAAALAAESSTVVALDIAEAVGHVIAAGQKGHV
jgi:ADP-dependent NAD(P)H-hydrate dehydratase / NAD(P)H-hydrate epimerase